MRPVHVPASIEAMMNRGAALVISISGGKDGQATLNLLTKLHRERGWRGPLVAVHADLGRIEWEGTGTAVHRQARENDVPLHVVSAGDMVDRWKRRMNTLAGTGKPFWSSAANRYCTSDMKRNPIDKYLRKFKLVVSVDGVRAEESNARAQKPVVNVRKQITASRLRALPVDQLTTARALPTERIAIDWHGIHDFTEDEVWQAIGISLAEVNRRRELYRAGREVEAFENFPGHHAYVRGNQRLSCSMCVLASDSDIINGARHNPAVARELVQMERESGFTFKHKKSLESIIASVILVDSQRDEGMMSLSQ